LKIQKYEQKYKTRIKNPEIGQFVQYLLSKYVRGVYCGGAGEFASPTAKYVRRWDSRQLESARQSEETSAAAQPITTSARRDTSIYTSTEIHLDQSVSNSCVDYFSASDRYNL
jgi:hypothetical protein